MLPCIVASCQAVVIPSIMSCLFPMPHQYHNVGTSSQYLDCVIGILLGQAIVAVL